MDSILLRATLHRPVTPAMAIPRPALLRRLVEGLSGKVTLVSAPAGFGKSTLVSAWLDQISASVAAVTEGAASDLLNLCWLSLEEADNQLQHFVRYVAAAIEVHRPQSCGAVVELLYAKPSPSIEALADVMSNCLIMLPGRLMVVLDDLHHIDDAAVFAFVTRLIETTVHQLHFVLITRVDPPLPLSRWRAQGQLNELRLNDLNFTLAETTAFLCMNLEQTPDPAMATTLHERTEGWVVGLRLVALALRGQTDYTKFAAEFANSTNRFVIDYLVDDVLDHQPPNVQSFLISTSILTRFCPALCAEVIGIDEASARQLIDHLTRANLFLIELSTPAQWYRFHHQFQSMLLSRLHERYDQQAIAQMHRDAAAWLATNGQVDEALRHLIAGADIEGVADLVQSQRLAALNEHRFHEIEEWLALLPAARMNQRPALLLSLAWVQDHRLEFAQCLATVQRAQALLNEQADALTEVSHKLLQAEIIALRVSVDKTLTDDEALALIQQAWTQLRPYLTYTHCITVVWLAHACHRVGGVDRALEILHTTFDQTNEWSQMARCRLLYSAGILYWYNCNLAQAEAIFQHGLQLARQHNLPLAMTLCSFGLAVVASAHHQPELAETYHLAVIKEPHFQNGLRAVLSAYGLIEIYTQVGKFEEAQELVADLKTHALMMGRPYLITQVTALEAYLALRGEKPAAALRWALGEAHSSIYSSADRIPLIRAQILLAEGSPVSLQLASELLAELSQRHQAERTWNFWIETSVLQVLTWSRLGQKELALALLGRAVHRAVPNGVIEPFIAAGSALEPLLLELRKQPEHTDLARLLLAAAPAERTATTGAAEQELPEPLTERELDILALLAERLSNKEIAAKLVVSVHTVRNHVANIFGKLQVDSRNQAVERARLIGLLRSTSR